MYHVHLGRVRISVGATLNPDAPLIIKLSSPQSYFKKIMIEIALLILCLLAPSAIIQQSSSAPTCQQVMNQTVFNRCTRVVLRVKDTQGAQIATDQVGACYTQQGNTTAYQKCLCAKTSAILNWYLKH